MGTIPRSRRVFSPTHSLLLVTLKINRSLRCCLGSLTNSEPRASLISRGLPATLLVELDWKQPLRPEKRMTMKSLTLSKTLTRPLRTKSRLRKFQKKRRLNQQQLKSRSGFVINEHRISPHLAIINQPTLLVIIYLVMSRQDWFCCFASLWTVEV